MTNCKDGLPKTGEVEDDVLHLQSFTFLSVPVVFFYWKDLGTSTPGVAVEELLLAELLDQPRKGWE